MAHFVAETQQGEELHKVNIRNCVFEIIEKVVRSCTT